MRDKSQHQGWVPQAVLCILRGFCPFWAANSASSKQRQKQCHSNNPIFLSSVAGSGAHGWGSCLGMKTYQRYWEEGHCFLSFDMARNLVGNIQKIDRWYLMGRSSSPCAGLQLPSACETTHVHLLAGFAALLPREEKAGKRSWKEALDREIKLKDEWRCIVFHTWMLPDTLLRATGLKTYSRETPAFVLDSRALCGHNIHCLQIEQELSWLYVKKRGTVVCSALHLGT